MKNVEKSSSAGTTVDSSTKADVSSVSQPIAKPDVSCRLLSANELRIGNKIKRKSNGNICTVNWGIIKDFELYDTCSVRDYIPIALSPKILKQYGFKYGFTGTGEDKVQYWDKRTVEHKHSFGTFYFSIVKWYKGEFTFSHHTIRSDCKYLHQLQNLWFSLTGKELQAVANGS